VEVPLTTNAQWQALRARDAGLFARVLGGLSSRDDHATAEAIPKAFGLSESSVSRRFVHARARALQQLQERRLDDREWLVLLLDGKSFASDQLVVARGVTTTGEKRILGLVQTATENKAVCAILLRDLKARGFVAPHGLLVVFDGAKGLRAAVRDVDGPDVAVQRCQWHKRENVVGSLR
jgi:putative transposase